MADDEGAFDAADVMSNIVRTNTVPPPKRKPSRLLALSMLAAVTAATLSDNRGLRNAVGVVIAREGTDASAKPIWKALSPKNTREGISGSLHSIMLKPATAAGRKLAQAARGTKCFMFKQDQCPSMIYKDTVFMLTASGLLCVAYTISYVNGKVGCSKNYTKHNKGRKCKGWQCFVDLHHVATRSYLSGLCFVPNAINKLIEKIVNPRPVHGLPDKNIEASYKAHKPHVILDNISELKGHEDSIRAGDVDCVECQRGTSKGHPSKLLLTSLMPGQPNFVYLKRADSAHRRLAGVGTRDEGIYQFVSTSRPDFIHPSCVIQVYTHIPPKGSGQPKNQKLIRVLHCRCPILGIGGTKVGGGSSGEESKSKTWPVVLHHLGKDDLSLVVFCHNEVNLALDFIP
ncbi:unnamed protein product [Pelagomonas calceolata]|uniref:Uncharacterized protein n=1 Tax=Pelagomonas calceolata TaxID=35677 RepID=A0A8J2SS02_9STRA|nr:unnamed protein product [Pelagomonas calceolata]|mmetsp:Transcript_23487/g.72152  ORF Transcript_23487/g.72152 Transcript_23487/m.72152 type:complete len:400 (-) Transcript_23487:17-1216(-)